LEKLIAKQKFIYPEKIEQQSSVDEYDQEFKNKLQYVFGVEIVNGSDFVKGVQFQLKLDAQF
jgi:hypothetical protein